MTPRDTSPTPPPPDWPDEATGRFTVSALRNHDARIGGLAKCYRRVDRELAEISAGLRLGKWAAGLVAVALIGLSGYVVLTTIATATRQEQVIQRLDDVRTDQRDISRDVAEVREKLSGVRSRDRSE